MDRIPHPVVHDPLIILTFLMADAKYFSISNVCTFFSISIHMDYQYTFAFNVGGATNDIDEITTGGCRITSNIFEHFSYRLPEH